MKTPDLQGFFVAWEADALPTELFPLWALQFEMLPDGQLDGQSPDREMPRTPPT